VQRLRNARKTRLSPLADVAGYGASADASISLLRNTGATPVAGNHEFGLLSRLDASIFNPLALVAFAEQRTAISTDDVEW
jgi:hypothetical protein